MAPEVPTTSTAGDVADRGGPDPDEATLSVSSLTFAYPGWPPTISGLTLRLPRGSRCLLAGANGAGKTTLLQLLAGKHMVAEDAVRILGRPAFHDTALTTTGALAYLGGTWRRDVACAGKDMPLAGDISAQAMIYGVAGVDPERRRRLVELLDVDLTWSMMRVSDGQRRRVQMAMGLLRPYEVLLMDEVRERKRHLPSQYLWPLFPPSTSFSSNPLSSTRLDFFIRQVTVDMDVVGRLDLLAFFVEECELRGATIVYATHIFDGLESWATHFAYVEGGVLKRGAPVADLPELAGRKLLPTMEAWLREERDGRWAREEKDRAEGKEKPRERQQTIPKLGFDGRPSKHFAYSR